jgi:SAM-dependent methyltransferase
MLETEKNILCGVCGRKQVAQYEITDLEETKVDWYHCYCGTIFHEQGIDKSVFNDAYLKEWQEKKGIDLRANYILKIYLPLIEEMILGRKFLDVGFTVPHNILHLRDRGWIATGVDIIPNDFITEDFEKFQFEDKFDFIHMGHVLESFQDPVRALANAYNHLNMDGVLMITHPAPELVHFVGLAGFGNWSHKYAHVFISEKELYRIAIGMGFDWIMCRLNFSQRFVSWNDRHIILQKKY